MKDDNTPGFRKLKIVKEDDWLVPVENEVWQRYHRYQKKLELIKKHSGSLLKFASVYQYFGIHYDSKAKGWFYREWAPRAADLFLFGDFNDWNRHSHRMIRSENGIWEIFLPYDQYHERFCHLSRVKVLVHGENGWNDRIPVFINRLIQDETTRDFAGQLWFPEKAFDWQKDDFKRDTSEPLLIYECHVGMAQEELKVGSYTEFADKILPKIKAAGYNAIQVMALAEHPYYGSFGYHVSNYFAPASRQGTPDELKYLILTAHQMGIAVIMDVVHSHTVKNYNEGLVDFDGQEGLYTHASPRGDHPHWDSKLFDYGKPEVLQFLLSNIKYWMREFHVDGFRFDGVTSMMYFHHGYIDTWDRDSYFGDGVEWDAVTYLQLANTLIHQLNPRAISIAEDVSGMPGLCHKNSEGGLGFDYRLGMGIPDFWIKILKEKTDEQWDLNELYYTMLDRKFNTPTIAYCESHDQALVGDKTLAFRLMDKEMYWGMTVNSNNLVIDRGIALHKLIRLFTISLGGNAWLNFMGNEFGHPEWIDFPRAGNSWSYALARRQWSLLENPNLRYTHLAQFDIAMLDLVKKHHVLDAPYPNLLNIDHLNKTIVFERAGLIFVFNWHTDASIMNYQIQLSDADEYKLILCSDDVLYGGFGRIDTSISYFALLHDKAGAQLSIYNTNRTCSVFKKID